MKRRIREDEIIDRGNCLIYRVVGRLPRQRAGRGLRLNGQV
jgi:hypothetical protein